MGGPDQICGYFLPVIDRYFGKGDAEKVGHIVCVHSELLQVPAEGYLAGERIVTHLCGTSHLETNHGALYK